MVAVISVDADPFLSSLYLSCHLEDTGIVFFLVALCSRPVIKENTAHVAATRQNKILLLWHAILNRSPYYGM